MVNVERTPKFSEISWIATLIGTAVGAGILYLPLQVGISTIWALVFLSGFVFPLIYHAHKSIVTLLLLGKGGLDYSGVVAQHLGRRFGFLTTLIYFVTFYAVLASYSIGLNNNLGEYLFKTGITEANWAKGPFLSLVILSSFAVLHLIGQKAILKVMTVLTFFLIATLLGISIYLIPFWDLSTVRQASTVSGLVDDVLLILPILTLSFVFFPAMSSMVTDFEKSGGASQRGAKQKLNRIVLKTSLTLLIFVFLFVYSCVFSLTPAEFEHAIKENLNCLTILSYKEGISPVLASLGVLVGIAALYTSFAGVFFAVRDSAHELMSNMGRYGVFEKFPFLADRKIMDCLILIFINLSVWATTVANPSVMDAFGLIISPLVALFIFIFPVVILVRVNGFQVLKKPLYIFIFLTGILILFSYELGTLLKEYSSR
jgi:serine transporter